MDNFHQPLLSTPAKKHLISSPSKPAPYTSTFLDDVLDVAGSREGTTADMVVHDEPSPPHTLQESFALPLLGTPSQPLHVLLSPPQIPEQEKNIESKYI